jgi:hypothetical protein
VLRAVGKRVTATLAVTVRVGGTDDDEFASPPKRTRPVKDKAGSSFVTPIDLTDTSNPTFRSGSDNIVDLTIDSDEEGDGVTKSVL